MHYALFLVCFVFDLTYILDKLTIMQSRSVGIDMAYGPCIPKIIFPNFFLIFLSFAM